MRPVDPEDESRQIEQALQRSLGAESWRLQGTLSRLQLGSKEAGPRALSGQAEATSAMRQPLLEAHGDLASSGAKRQNVLNHYQEQRQKQLEVQQRRPLQTLPSQQQQSPYQQSQPLQQQQQQQQRDLVLAALDRRSTAVGAASREESMDICSAGQSTGRVDSDAGDPPGLSRSAKLAIEVKREREARAAAGPHGGARQGGGLRQAARRLPQRACRCLLGALAAPLEAALCITAAFALAVLADAMDERLRGPLPGLEAMSESCPGFPSAVWITAAEACFVGTADLALAAAAAAAVAAIHGLGPRDGRPAAAAALCCVVAWSQEASLHRRLWQMRACLPLWR